MDKMLERILEVIPKKHGSKKELCDHLKIRTNAVTEWESGRNKSYPKYIPQIAAYYGVSSDWLLGLTDDKEQKNNPADISASEAREKSNLIIEGLTPDEANLVRAYAQGVIANRKPQ